MLRFARIGGTAFCGRAFGQLLGRGLAAPVLVHTASVTATPPPEPPDLYGSLHEYFTHLLLQMVESLSALAEDVSLYLPERRGPSDC